MDGMVNVIVIVSMSARSLTSTLHALKNTGVQIDFIAQLNDSGVTFDEIADFLDKVDRSIPLDLLDKFK